MKDHNRHALQQLIAQVHARSGPGPALLESARWGFIENVAHYLDLGVDIDFSADDGVTALMLAAFGPHKKLVQYLLNRGANFNAVDSKGDTVLMSLMGGFGREANIRALGQILLDAGADPSVKNNEGLRAVDYARGKYSQQLLDLITPRDAAGKKNQ